MKKVRVKEVFIKDGYVNVFLDNDENYEMIYRAAKGVYWNGDLHSLFYKGIVSQEEHCFLFRGQWKTNIILI